MADHDASAGAEAPAPRAPRRNALRVSLRIAVAVVLLVLAFRLALPENERGLLETLRSAWVSSLPVALLWFAVAFAISGLASLAVALRFRRLLRALHLRSGLGPIFRAYLVANSIGMVLPSNLLSDVYRVADARIDTGRVVEVLAMVALERILGLAALGAVVLAAAPLLPLAEVREAAPLLLGVSFLLVTASLSVLHPAVNRLLQRLVAPLERLSPVLAGAAVRALAALTLLGGQRGVVLQAFGLSLVAQGCQVAAVAVLANPLDTSVAWYWFPAIVPIVQLVTLLPISIGGAGVREYLFIRMFGAVGVRPDVALSLSLSVFALTLAWGVVGILVFAWGRRHPGSLPEPAGATDPGAP